MIGSLIGAGLSVAGGIFGSIKARKERKKAERRMAQQLKENENWYNRRYNEDVTQRADAVRAMELMRENMNRMTDKAASTAAVVGGDEASVAAAREAGSKALANATSSIAAQGASEKNAIEQQYLNNKSAIQDQQNAYDFQSAQNIAGATQRVADAAASIGAAYDVYQEGLREDERYNKLVAALAGSY